MRAVLLVAVGLFGGTTIVALSEIGASLFRKNIEASRAAGNYTMKNFNPTRS